jgi:hypothetical protein
MKKVFTYHNITDGEGWFNADAYDDQQIEAITDPQGGSETFLPTAIPSPFARIDLVKSAFRNAAKSPDLKSYTKDGDSIVSREDEKLVSDALDLAELLFNMDSISADLKIIPWDKDIEIEKLKSGSEMHRRLAETLKLYIDQDNQSYNFDLLQRLYLVQYKHKIIGATSPVTLFFASANDLSFANIRLTTDDVLFDENYAPLYERDIEFQLYLYSLFSSNNLLKSRCRDFYDYLQRNLKILNNQQPALYNRINELGTVDLSTKYSVLDTGTAGSTVEVMGIPLWKRKKEDMIASVKESDFIIDSRKFKGDLKPLVLQNNFNKSLRYTSDFWNKNTQVPYLDAEFNFDNRWLPGQNVQYPYLTVSDFLEPYLTRLVYPLNKECYFDGNASSALGDELKGYLLPIKSEFFKYFDASDLRGDLSDGKPMFELIIGAANSVKAILRIPIQKNKEYITFERTYYPSLDYEITSPDESKNKGVIIENQFGVTIFPFIKCNTPELKAHYRIQLVDRDVTGLFKRSEYDLNFFDNSKENELEIRAKKYRSRKIADAVDSATSQYFILNDEFDYIQVKNGLSSGIIIPKWPEYKAGKESFTFAVDFGTTNTHVEYKVGNGTPRPFDVTVDDTQIAPLFHPEKTTEDFGGTGAIAIRELIDHEFIPQYLGNNSEYKFPHRTVIAESYTLNIETETFSLADFNIPFAYEKKPERDKILSNLKWARKEKGNEKRVRAFFENLMMLLRNKVIFNRGSLTETRLIWFYPSSMKPARRADLENTWNELFEEYFGKSNKPIGITESLAPFYYYKGTNQIQGGAYKPVLSIDIGGGTTDVVIFKSNRPLLLTSFKFAANALFGDAFSEYGAAGSNGFMLKYFPHFENLLAVNKLYDLSKILANIKDKNRTEDINTFLFSIENNSKVKDKKMFSYNSLLAKDDDLKIAFLYFYLAIIYHIAQLMKSKEIELPKNIVFSGTGSKILSIITPNAKGLEEVTKRVFEKVYEEPYDADGLNIKAEKEMPKEVTCKGGLMSNADDLAIDINSIKTVYNSQLSKDKLTYNDLNEETKQEVVNEIKVFIDTVKDINRSYSFADHFGVSSKAMDLYNIESIKHIRDYLEEGLEFNRQLDETGAGDKELEETLFFYPLIGSISNLITPLSTITPINN